MFGKPLASHLHLEQRLPIFLALPVFASDAISSVAYGTQEILLVLAAVVIAPGLTASHYLIWISLAIAVLMLIVATSYRRAVHLYPTSGGSYTVTKSNLGPIMGLVAAGALLIDYIMTVAVSISSGVDALTSAYLFLKPYSVELAITFILLITLVNLRGAKESGWWFALPLYAFVGLVGSMIIISFVKFITHSYGSLPIPAHAIVPESTIANSGLLLLFVILHAFSNGCSSLTGTEAISNGVSAFKPPESKNAARTLGIMVAVLIFLFLGVSFSAAMYNLVPADPNLGGITVLAQIAQANFAGNLSIFFYLTQFATLAILIVAANTSYADFPRLLAFVARDRFAPKAFISQGDRLVFNRGILALAIISSFLVFWFNANVNLLIGLYAVGVFLCFTLSQLGMIRKFFQLREKGWKRAVLINAIGAVVTGMVTAVVLITKFTHGAVLVVILIPILILVALAIHKHYEWFDKKMLLHPKRDVNPLTLPPEPLSVIVLLSSDVHRGTIEGLECARDIVYGRTDSILRAVHIEIDHEKTTRLKEKWKTFVEPFMSKEIRLDIIPSPYRWLIEPVMEYLDEIDKERPGHRVILVLPEFDTGSFWTQLLHNFTGRRLRNALLNRPNVTVVSSRYFMQPMKWLEMK
ncbi:MAG: APC family permease [bacterium]